MFKLEIVPTQLNCPRCGEYIKDVDLAEGFEVLTAGLLQACNASFLCPDYDVYDSRLFPGLTFQVKYAQARERLAITKTVKGRTNTWDQRPTWSWAEAKALGANWYILFGIANGYVYPFAVPTWIWERESYDTGNGGRILTISTEEKSRCGRYVKSYKRNKFWQHYLRQWPDDLFSRIRHYEKQGNIVQLGLTV